MINPTLTARRDSVRSITKQRKNPHSIRQRTLFNGFQLLLELINEGAQLALLGRRERIEDTEVRKDQDGQNQN